MTKGRKEKAVTDEELEQQMEEENKEKETTEKYNANKGRQHAIGK